MAQNVEKICFFLHFRERRAYVGLTTFFRLDAFDGSTLPAAISAVCTIYGLCLWNRSMVVIVKEGRDADETKLSSRVGAV